jgi:hypothetical protein
VNLNWQMKNFNPLLFVITVFGFLIGGFLLGEAVHQGSGKWLGGTLVATIFFLIQLNDNEFRRLPIAVLILGLLVLFVMIGRTAYLLFF